jgi:hypothetical protein
MAIVCGGVRYDEKPTGVARLKRKAKNKKSKKKGRRK